MKNKIVSVGSIAIDELHTSKGSRPNIIGGSATFFSVAASRYNPVKLIGIVGDGPKSNGFPTTVYVNSCVKIPCNPGENRIHSTLTF